MPETDTSESTVHRRGAEPSLIEHFGIEGLHGYRSISLESDYAATILIAKNGTGKTTLLGALDAFLRLQFSRLRTLEFSEIRCRIRGEQRDLVLTHNDVIEFLQVPNGGELINLASRANVEPAALFSFILDECANNVDFVRISDSNPLQRSIVSAFNYNYRDAELAVEGVRASLLERQPTVAMISRILKRVLAGIEIVYLPTYRRIELALRGDSSESRRRGRPPKFDLAVGSLFTGEIQFGLTDISERLSELNQKIVFESNNGYRKISANIINELLDGSFDADVPSSSDVPSQEELKLFFERLERGRRQRSYMPVSIPNLEKVYTREGVPASSSKFLSYFLAKLATVIRSTKDLERPVDSFIDNCNRYLASKEPSTLIGEGEGSPVVDGKVLRINRTSLRVHVESVPGGRRISLDALSSGEKQMISLFAKMFLYPERKIVLIDEPELSLSIDWQREILVDVLSAPLCTQLIAITHSPFVFDNELEPFARSIKIGRAAIGPARDEDLEGDLDE